jgi:glycosyltransferase involved in cell wall biosynthesis
MKKLLIFVDWFLPGYKAGGQIQSCANLALALKDEMQVHVVTRDRDLGDEQIYEGITPDTWQQMDNGLRVLYASPSGISFWRLRKMIDQVNPDCIYFNSMFSYKFTILPLLVASSAAKKSKLVLAPRGMLHKGALQFKSSKKQTFLRLFKSLGLHRKVIFHATDPVEAVDIRNFFGAKTRIEHVNDFPNFHQEPLQTAVKQPGELKCLFVSRISPKKNLLYLISFLKSIKEKVTLTIVGPVETEGYWEECKRTITTLPSNVTVEYKGAVPNHQLPDVYRQHHLFVLPTHGENFGHVIFESLINGRPLLISDQTPWRSLTEKRVGWDWGLNNTIGFTNALQQAASWDQAAFDAYCNASWQFAADYIRDSSLKKEYLSLFRE